MFVKETLADMGGGVVKSQAAWGYGGRWLENLKYVMEEGPDSQKQLWVGRGGAATFSRSPPQLLKQIASVIAPNNK